MLQEILEKALHDAIDKMRKTEEYEELTTDLGGILLETIRFHVFKKYDIEITK